MSLTPLDQFLDSLRPSYESFLLARYIQIESNDRMLDIGCGSGYLCFFLASHLPKADNITGVDIQPELIEVARRNENIFLQLENIGKASIDFIQGDAREMRYNKPFDVVVTNPPFFEQRSGRASPDAARQTARQDTLLPLEDLFQIAQANLKPGGRFYWVFPADRCDDIEHCMHQFKFQLIDKAHRDDVRKRGGGILLMTMKKN